jgi:hypothetical protein
MSNTGPDSDPDPDPPADLPTDVAAALQSLDGRGLREAIVYANELLRARHEHAPQVDPAIGEEVVRVIEHDGYTEVHKRHRREGGVYVYHVTAEPHPEGDREHWSLVGREEPPD